MGGSVGGRESRMESEYRGEGGGWGSGREMVGGCSRGRGGRKRSRNNYSWDLFLCHLFFSSF